MDKKDIISAYCRIREIDNTIPDSVLDFMKDSAIAMLKTIPCSGEKYWICKHWHKQETGCVDCTKNFKKEKGQ